MNIDLPALLSREAAGNSLQAYLSALLVYLGVLAALYLARGFLLIHLKRVSSKIDADMNAFLADMSAKVRSLEYHLFAFFIATRGLQLSAGLDKAIRIVFVIALSYRAATLLQAALAYALRKAAGASERENGSASAMQVLRLALNIVVWAGALVFVLENLGISISTVVAGLGIGGVAVALAAQQVLGDLFASFVIFMDRPFRAGDFIALGDISGTVERVGIKATRLRGLGGELLVIPNKDLTSAAVRNYREMRRRRVVFSFSAAHDTPCEKLAAIPGMVRDAIGAAAGASFERAHLCGIGESGRQFEAVYHVENPEYGAFMDIQQAVALALLKRFETEGIRFAAPTRAILSN
ncbi:MAG: mechanosensitive ion channel family protein [Elusimicrobia bacterium]|nr:mechanosensitive ion channel family protein [Elusimicrobiota bacterium]